LSRREVIGWGTDNNETDDVAELIQGLDNRRIWLENSDALVRIGTRAVPALIEALRDQRPRVRNRAIRTLDMLHRSGVSVEAAIPTLRELRLQDPEVYIRRYAASVLRRINRLS
jgi:HEAT repeat protein